MKLPQRAVAFVRLHDEESIPLRQPCRAFQLRHLTAHRVPRSRAQPAQHMRQQRRGGGLAVHARHAHAAALAQQRRQRHGPPQQRHPQLHGPPQRRVVAPHGGCVNHQRRPAVRQMFGRMPFANVRAPGAQLSHRRVGL